MEDWIDIQKDDAHVAREREKAENSCFTVLPGLRNGCGNLPNSAPFSESAEC